MPITTIFGLGLVSLDLAVEVRALPPDGRVHATRALTLAGGMAANTLTALAALGWRTEMVGVVGDDAPGKRALQNLRDRNVGIKQIERRPGAVTPQAVCIAQTEKGRRTIIGLPERNVTLRSQDLPAFLHSPIPHSPSPISAVLHTDGWHGPASLAALQAARRRGWLTSFNAGWHTPYVQRLARLADVVVVSADFAREVTRHKRAPQALYAVAQWLGWAAPGPAEQWLVLTAGAKGAWGMSCGTGLLPVPCGNTSRTTRKQGLDRSGTLPILHQPAFAVNVVDSTGAGDAFHAGLLHGRLQGWPLGESLRWASAAGALACTELGAGSRAINLKALQRMLKNNNLRG